MKVNRVDYRLVPGLTHAMAGSLFTRKCSTDTLISSSFTGSAIDHADCTSAHSAALKAGPIVFVTFQSEKLAYQSEHVESAIRAQFSIPDLWLILRIRYLRLTAIAVTAGKYVKYGRIFFRTSRNYVIFGKPFPHSPYLNMG